MYVVLCVHHTKSSRLPPCFTLFYLPQNSLPSGNYHTLVCVNESFFFASSLFSQLPTPSPLTAVSLPFVSMSLSLLAGGKGKLELSF